jgi:5-(carboxyamino)imidazole ribonucleotide synthase
MTYGGSPRGHLRLPSITSRRFEELCIPVPRYAIVERIEDIDTFSARIGGPIVIKATGATANSG